MKVKVKILHVVDYKIIGFMGVNLLTNIIDGMDEARFQAGNVKANKPAQKKGKDEEKKMPMVLKNLKNGS